LPINPVKGIGRFYSKAKKQADINPWISAEAVQFLATSEKAAPEYFPLFLTALNTGMRSGELAGLQWSDIDFAAKIIRVRRQVSAGLVCDLKTVESKRVVDMSDALIEELSNLKKQQDVAWGNKGQTAPVWIFANVAGKPPDMQKVKNRYFQKCMTSAKVRRIRFHDLRHTFASILLQNGESLQYVKEQLGHTSIKTTVDIYGKLIPGTNRQAVNKLPKINRQSSLKVLK